MKCPRCQSTQLTKNGHRRGKQCYLCADCGRQFVESYSPKGYSEDTRNICLKMHHNGFGLREIERATGISHNTISNWVKQSVMRVSDSVDRSADGSVDGNVENSSAEAEAEESSPMPNLAVMGLGMQTLKQKGARCGNL